MISTKSLLLELQEIKTKGIHSPQRVLSIGDTLLERGYLKNSPDDGWDLLDQLCLAAAECGNYDLANICAERLSTRFPNSPRVAVLIGTILESKGLLLEAEKYYLSQMEGEEGGTVNLRKRRIALHLSSPHLSPPSSSSSSLAVKPKSKSSSNTLPISPVLDSLIPILPNRTTGLALLIDYLDTFYSDLEGWSQLASVYAGLGLYPQSLSALSHLLLLAPHNPFYLLLHAETAYTSGDYDLAYKEFLRVIEMNDDGSSIGGVAGGGVLRASLGAKLCLTQLSSSEIRKKVDLMVTESILDTTGGDSDGVSKGIVRSWLEAF